MKRNKGFTLVELLIVIVIIGILAAIIVPSVSSAIEKANLANDQSDVKNMNTILALQAIEDNVDYYEDGYEVQNILKAQGYDMTPQASGYSFWYNQAANKIELLNTEKALKGEVTVEGFSSKNIVGNSVYAAEDADFSRPLEAIIENIPHLLYIDEGDRAETTVIKAIHGLSESFKDVNLETATPTEENTKLQDAFTSAMEAFGAEENSFIAKHLDTFNPETTLYVSESGFFGGSANGNIVTGVKRVYIRADVTEIPECNLSSIVLEGSGDDNEIDINLPRSVEKVAMGGFTNITSVNCKITIIVHGETNLAGYKVAPGITVKGSSNVSTMKTIAVNYVYYAEGGVEKTQGIKPEVKNYLPFSYEKNSDGNWEFKNGIGKFVVDMDSIRSVISSDSKVKVESRFDSKSGHHLLTAYVENKDGTIAAGIFVKYIYITPQTNA